MQLAREVMDRKGIMVHTKYLTPLKGYDIDTIKYRFLLYSAAVMYIFAKSSQSCTYIPIHVHVYMYTGMQKTG